MYERQIARRRYLWHKHRIRCRFDRRREIVAQPRRIEPIHPDHDLTTPKTLSGRGFQNLSPRKSLSLGGNRIFQIKDQAVAI
jgi:hypothetical protein